MKKKSMVVIGMVVGCLMMVAGAAWAITKVIPVAANGTVTVGNLVWLLNPNSCLGKMNWDSAVSRAESLASGQCGLADGSKAGDWRLPTSDELESIYWNRSQFSHFNSDGYWSSTADNTGRHYFIFWGGDGAHYNYITGNSHAWPVRGVVRVH